MAPVSLLMFLLMRLSVHSSSASRVRPSSLQSSHLMSKRARVVPNVSDGSLPDVLPKAQHVSNLIENRREEALNLTRVVPHHIGGSPPSAPAKAEHASNLVEDHPIIWNRSFIDASSLLGVALSQGGIMASASRLVGAVVALFLVLSVMLCLCGVEPRGDARDSMRSRDAGAKFRAAEKLAKHSRGGYVYGASGSKSSPGQGQSQSPTYPSVRVERQQDPAHEQQSFPKSFVEEAIAQLSRSFGDEQEDPEERHYPRKIDYRQIIARLSQTIKKVPTGKVSYGLQKSFGIGPQERHVAVWWCGQSHTWAEAKFGWWKTKQAHLDRKEPKGDFYLKEVSQVRLTDEKDGFDEPGVCISRKEGEDDLLIFFSDSDFADQFVEDLTLLVRKVKKTIKETAAKEKRPVC